MKSMQNCQRKINNLETWVASYMRVELGGEILKLCLMNLRVCDYNVNNEWIRQNKNDHKGPLVPLGQV